MSVLTILALLSLPAARADAVDLELTASVPLAVSLSIPGHDARDFDYFIEYTTGGFSSLAAGCGEVDFGEDIRCRAQAASPARTASHP